MINWKTRIKSLGFWIGLAGVVVSPVLAYTGASLEDFTTWKSVGDAIYQALSNPYLFFSVVFAILGFLGVANDPNSKGLSDTARAMQYTEPVDNAKQSSEVKE